MTDLAVLIPAAAGLVGLLLLLDRVIENPRAGMYVVVVLGVAEVALELPEPSVGGITVTVNDVIFMVVVTSLVARLLRGWSPSPLQIGVMLLLVIMGYSIARGAMSFALPSAVNEAREMLYFFAVVLYASALSPDRFTRAQVTRIWFGYAGALVGLTVLRWLIVFGGLPGRGDWYDPSYGGLRVIYSNETLAIALAFMMVLPKILRGEAGRFDWPMACVFGGSVLLLQHRSVIAVMLVGAAVLVWRHRDQLSRTFVYMVGAAAVVMGALLVTVFDAGQLASQASSADASNTVTFAWRVQGWQVLLEDAGPTGPEEALFGQPYGSGFERVLPTGERVSVAPHNMYLELLFRVGLVGAVVYLAMGLVTWNRLRQDAPTGGGQYLDNSTLSAIMVAFAMYMIPYNLFSETGILLGLALSAAAARQVRSAPPIARSEAGPPVVAESDPMVMQE